MRNPFQYFNNSPGVIRLSVMMYIRYPRLSASDQHPSQARSGLSDNARAETALSSCYLKFDDFADLRWDFRGCILAGPEPCCNSPGASPGDDNLGEAGFCKSPRNFVVAHKFLKKTQRDLGLISPAFVDR
jgi:hypothetical protein